jgi:hypothetical protein
MKVTGWTWWENHEYLDLDEAKYAEAYAHVADEMRKQGYKFTGNYHQNGDFGVPIIDDIWLFQVSQRTWGNLMVTAYPDEIDDSDGYGYCQWAWVVPDGQDMVLPEEV